MAKTLMQLGDYSFSLDTAAYQVLFRSTAYQWASQDRMGQRPSAQHLGCGAETMRLNGVIYPEYAGGLTQMDAMREEAEKGEPLILVDGNGYVWQQWCITSIEETQKVFNDYGEPKKVAFRLQLSRYGEDL